MTALNELSLTEVSTLIQSRRVQPGDVVKDCLARINVREPLVQAFTYLNQENALIQAEALDRSVNDNPLYGIPVGIKDIMNTSDMPTTMGSPIFSNYRPTRDCSCVAMLRDAGAVLPGKTETTEFAYFCPGKTRNPHALTHTPGGSSMGSAAAVADKMLPYAVGSQTAGSVIRPAAYCGVVGYKSSHGCFSLEGILGLAQNLDSLGFFVRNPRDLLLIIQELQNTQAASSEIRKPPRIGFVRTPHWDQLEPYQKQQIESVCGRLSDLACDVTELEIGPTDGVLTESQVTVMAYEASRSLAGEFQHNRNLLSVQIIDLIESGQNTTFEQYNKAMNIANIWQRKLQDIFEKLDVLITPSALGEAPVGLDATGDPVCNRMWTLLKVPSISLPAGIGPSGLPLGIQLIGKHNEDFQLICNAIWVSERL